MLSAEEVFGWCKLTSDLDPKSVVLHRVQLVLMFANESNFTFSGYLTT